MVQSNFRNDILQFKFNWLAILIFALAFCLFANATVIPDNTTIVGDLTIQSTNGIDINPGSDTATDLISIGVTGSPKISWNETQDAIQFIEKLLVGTNAILSKTVNGSPYTSKMSLDTNTSTDSGGIDINLHGDSDASYGVLSMLRSRGTHASPTIVQADDLISSIVGLGFDGTDYEPTSSIEMRSDGTPGSNDMPGRIDFKTVSDGSRVLNQVMRINSNASVLIGTTSNESSSLFEVQSVTKGSRPAPRMAQTQRNSIVSPATGLLVFNNDAVSFDFYDSSSWQNLLSSTSTQEFSGKTVTDALKFKESGGGSNFMAFQAPASLASDITYTLPDADGTSGQALKTDGAGVLSWGEASGGSGGINYIENPDAEVDTTGYATYADAAGTSPVNGTGGSANVTWTRSTSSPLRSLASFIFTKDASNRQGEGVSYDFSVDTADQAKVMQISFDYLVSSGTFVAGSSSASSDVTVWIYDVTNSVLIQPSSFKLLSNSSTISDKFNATFQTASNSTSYRLIFHVGSTSASAYVLKFDSIAVSPSTYVYGTPITDWKSFTPSGSWSTNTTYTGLKKKEGDVGKYQVKVALGGAPTSATLTINMPSGETIDTSKLANITGSARIGTAAIEDNGVGYYTVGEVYYNSTSSVVVSFGFNNAFSGTTYTRARSDVTQASPITFASGDVIDIKFEVPILGWSSSVQTSDQTDTRVVATRASLSSNQNVSTTAETTVVFNATSFDSHGSFNTSTGLYTVQVPGKYDIDASLYLSSAASEVFTAAIYKNSTLVAQKFFTATSDVMVNFGDTVDCVSGDVIKVTIDSTADTSYIVIGNNGATFVRIRRQSGPSAIAASESINARYTTAGQSVSNATLTIIDFGTKDYDSHGAVTTGASWKFTAPISGVYEVSANITTTSTGNFSAAEYLEGRVYKGGAIHAAKIHSDYNGSTSNKSVQIVTRVKLLAGEYIDFREYQTSGGSMPLETVSGYNWIEIERIGN